MKQAISVDKEKQIPLSLSPNRTFRFILFLLFGFIFSAMATTLHAQDTRISLNARNTTVRDVLKMIESKSDYHFAYNNKLVDVTRKITVTATNEKISDILKKIFANTDVTSTVVDHQIVLASAKAMGEPVGQSTSGKRVSGKVTDEKGQPLPGVTVVVKGTTMGTITDADGSYVLNKVSPNEILKFSFVGMQSREVKVSNQTIINIMLGEGVNELNEVVAIGYGTQKKKVLTGATVQIKGSDIAKLNTVSAMDALQGSTPGVFITKIDGQPGDGFNVSIRGLGTIGNSAPLYVVDGMVVDNIDYLAPSDIKSIDVLKDATAAIYGSRAANGVILVTTIQGKNGEKPSITYDGYFGVQNLYKKANPLNAQEYLTIVNEARVNSLLLPLNITGTAPSLNLADHGSLVPIVPDAAGILAGTNHGTNWMNEMTVKDAPIQRHSVSIEGGGTKSNYSLGFSYVSQQGILGKPVASNYQRYNFLINTNNNLIENKHMTILKVGENLTYFYDQKQGIGSEGVYGNDIFSALEADPLLPMYDTSGNYHYAIPWDGQQVNPIAQMVYNDGYNMMQNHNLIGQAYAEIQPIKNLIFRSSFGINMSAGSYRSFSPNYDLGPAVTSTYNHTFQKVYDGLGWTFNNTLSYNYSIQQHHVSALLGASEERGGLGGEYMYGSNANGIFNDFQHAYLSNNPIIYNDGNTSLQGAPWGISTIVSYFGRLNYDFKSTYLFSAVIRSDGSSTFAPGHRWGTFPSLSAGWVMSNESFMKSLQWVDFLKLRGSWGQNGNQSISPFQYLSTISSTNVEYFFGPDKTTVTTGAYPNILPNPNVTWETSDQTDIGVDGNFLSNRLIFTFDLYNKKTKNWLVQVPLQDIYGTNPPYMNGGDIQNRGYEIALGWRDHVGQLNYSINANIAYNHNEVTRIANNSGIIDGPANVFRNSDEWYRAQVGYPVGYFYGYKTNGIFQTEADVKAYVDPKTGQEIMPNAQPGDVRFVDLNKDGQINGNDRTMIGDPHPHFNYGVSFNLSFKGFDLSAVGTGVSGNQLAQATTFINKNEILGNYTTDILGRWHGAGTSNFLPRVVYGSSINTDYFSDLYMRSGAYFRISNVTLGYDFKQLLSLFPLQQLRLYVAIENMYTFTKYTGMDPQVGYAPSGNGWGSGIVQGIDLGSYPSPRTVMVGINVKF